MKKISKRFFKKLLTQVDMFWSEIELNYILEKELKN